MIYLIHWGRGEGVSPVDDLKTKSVFSGSQLNYCYYYLKRKIFDKPKPRESDYYLGLMIKPREKFSVWWRWRLVAWRIYVPLRFGIKRAGKEWRLIYLSVGNLGVRETKNVNPWSFIALKKIVMTRQQTGERGLLNRYLPVYSSVLTYPIYLLHLLSQAETKHHA